MHIFILVYSQKVIYDTIVQILKRQQQLSEWNKYCKTIKIKS